MLIEVGSLRLPFCVLVPAKILLFDRATYTLDTGITLILTGKSDSHCQNATAVARTAQLGEENWVQATSIFLFYNQLNRVVLVTLHLSSCQTIPLDCPEITTKHRIMANCLPPRVSILKMTKLGTED